MYKIGDISMDKYKTLPMILIFKTDLIIHIFSTPVTSHTLDPSKHVHIGITGKCYKKLAEPAEIKRTFFERNKHGSLVHLSRNMSN